MGPNPGNMRKYKYEDIYGNEFSYFVSEKASAEGGNSIIRIETDRGNFKPDRNDNHSVTLGVEYRTQAGTVEKSLTVKASLNNRDGDECWITDHGIAEASGYGCQEVREIPSQSRQTDTFLIRISK